MKFNIILTIIMACVGFSQQQETSLQMCSGEYDNYDTTQCIIAYLNEKFDQFITLVSTAAGANLNEGLSNILSAINGPTATKLVSIDNNLNNGIADMLFAINGTTATKLDYVNNTLNDGISNILSAINGPTANKLVSIDNNLNNGIADMLFAINGTTATKLDYVNNTLNDGISNILSAINGPTANKLNSINDNLNNGLSDILSACNSAKQSCDAVRVSGAECLCSIGEGICPPTTPLNNDQICHLPHDCHDIRYLGYTTSGVYTIYPLTLDIGLNVYCDLVTLNQGWIVIQRRQDGSVNFTQNWEAYRDGFGDLNGEFWLGNKNILALTEVRPQVLRVELETFELTTSQATYAHFRVENEEDNFRLRIGSYSGDAGNYMEHNNGIPFSTIDNDNDGNDDIVCAVQYKLAGWWYLGSVTGCGESFLNNPYSNGGGLGDGQVIAWDRYYSSDIPLKSTEMKIR